MNLKSVNWHLWPFCNYKCSFCFTRFSNVLKQEGKYLPLEKGKKLLQMLREKGMEKITFVGGEPLLCPWIGEYIEFSKKLGVITAIVTNGSRLNKRFLERFGWALDWVGLSLDSGKDNVEASLGRGNGEHIKNLLKVRELLDEYCWIQVKVNVTVTRLVLEEDLHEVLVALRPNRLKFFQVLPIDGENDDYVGPLLISDGVFQEFVKRHADLHPVAENNEEMRTSYVMLDPLGRFFQNTTGRYVFSDPVLEVGVRKALEQVGFSWQKFVKRGGLYEWSRKKQRGRFSPVSIYQIDRGISA